MSQRRDAGLCYNCPPKYSQEHMKECPGKGVYLLEVDGEPTITDGDAPADAEYPHISLNAITGIAAPLTMHLRVTISGNATRALVDSASTHCFLADTTARRLGLVPLPRPGLMIGVANGNRVACAGLCPAVPFRIANEDFARDFFVIPIGGYEVVLGC
jgi:hypothetical protein